MYIELYTTIAKTLPVAMSYSIVEGPVVQQAAHSLIVFNLHWLQQICLNTLKCELICLIITNLSPIFPHRHYGALGA
jgi:hypothetical protein